MPGLRRIIRNRGVSAVLAWLSARYIRFVWRSGRWRIENGDVPAKLIDEKVPFIACFWHGRMLMIPNAWVYDAPVSILISRHRDGVFISRTLRHLGVGTISGSSSRGGGGALIAMVRALKRGEYIGITPDGPRGPRMRVAPGAVTAARLSGARLLPVSFAASRCRMLSSWDRFVLPYPFSRGVVRIGTPISVSPDADDFECEAIRSQLEQALIDLTTTLDSELGLEPVSPEDLPCGQRLNTPGGTK